MSQKFVNGLLSCTHAHCSLFNAKNILSSITIPMLTVHSWKHAYDENKLSVRNLVIYNELDVQMFYK